MVRKTKVLICDNDTFYLNALVAYVMAWEVTSNAGIDMTYYSNENEFINAGGEYDIALLSPNFIKVLSEAPLMIKVKRIICLSEEKPVDDGEDFFFKYQSMDRLKDILSKERRQISLSQNGGMDGSGKITFVLSSVYNNISLPLSLSIAKIYGEREATAFLDIEDVSILSEIIHKEFSKDLVDLIYMMERKINGSSLEAFISEYQGFGIVSPFASLGQLSYITPEQWKMLIEYILSNGYKRLVVYCTDFPQGFGDIIGSAEDIILLKDTGYFGGAGTRIIKDFIEGFDYEDKCIEIEVPHISFGMTKAGIEPEVLIAGKLYEVARKGLGNKVGIY